jgi:hypothetical protein
MCQVITELIVVCRAVFVKYDVLVNPMQGFGAAQVG